MRNEEKTSSHSAFRIPHSALRLYPFSSHYLDRGGHRLHYLDEGAGDPVVMLHGNPTWSFYYRNLVLALRGTHRCVVPDHVGCGLSDKPQLGTYGYTLRERIDDLEALLGQLGVTRDVTLVLHDWGGMIGMGYAARHPERIARLVVLNTAAFRLPPSKPLPAALRLGRNTRLGAWLIRRCNAFSLGAVLSAAQKTLPAAVRQGYLAPYDSPANRVAVLRFVQGIPLTPADDGFDTVEEVERALPRFRDLPALVCWGMRDFVFDRHFLAEWRRHLPRAEVVRFPNAGHYVLEDAGAEIVRRVQHFLNPGGGDG